MSISAEPMTIEIDKQPPHQRKCLNINLAATWRIYITWTGSDVRSIYQIAYDEMVAKVIDIDERCIVLYLLADQGKNNLAFMSYFLLNNLDACIDMLSSAGRLPEAALAARSYKPEYVVGKQF